MFLETCNKQPSLELQYLTFLSAIYRKTTLLLTKVADQRVRKASNRIIIKNLTKKMDIAHTVRQPKLRLCIQEQGIQTTLNIRKFCLGMQ